jgi:hypothetical protein
MEEKAEERSGTAVRNGGAGGITQWRSDGGGENGDTPPTLHHHPVPPGFEVATHLPPVSPPFESSICPGGCLEVGGEGSVGGMHAQCCALQPDSVDGQLQALLEEVRYIVEHIREQDRQLRDLDLDLRRTELCSRGAGAPGAPEAPEAGVPQTPEEEEELQRYLRCAEDGLDQLGQRGPQVPARSVPPPELL